ncbi:hypothetical protein, partial [Salmonella sp. s55044]|uniref:hypothetical protein n=1 Tax=Salmonella sp. s55044 TaxID=3159677 RepID=UPI0039812F92
GYYVYIETSSGNYGYVARLLSPTLTTLGRHCLEFYYHMYGSAINTLNVYAKTTTLGNATWTKYGSQGNQWILGQVSIHVFTPTQIVFEGVRGSSFTGDIALDDISIVAGDCL